MNIRPIVLHNGHIPVVTFFGPVLIIFWVFLLPIHQKKLKALLNLVFYESYKSTKGPEQFNLFLCIKNVFLKKSSMFRKVIPRNFNTEFLIENLIYWVLFKNS